VNQAIIKQWEENKGKLREYFSADKKLSGCDYSYIVAKVFEIAVPKGMESYSEKWNTEEMEEIDFGHYQGDYIYIIPPASYQPMPSERLITTVSYGSCSGCDTLQAIQADDNWEEVPTESQLNDYMTLALHIVQNAKMLYGDDE